MFYLKSCVRKDVRVQVPSGVQSLSEMRGFFIFINLFDYSHIQLPVTEIIPEFIKTLQTHQTLIVVAPPGAGKSTILPLALLNQSFLNSKKIIMLEPRRLAAKSIAKRMADLLGEDVGKTVGYRVRMETCVSADTKIEVVTEGILTRMLQHDNALEQVSVVLFDEFHERNLQGDLALALCIESQQILRPDLRIVIMSATLNVPQLQQKLSAPVIESKGKQHPVELIYSNDADEFLLPELAAQMVSRAIHEQQGDVLVFLPGESEIKKCESILQSQIPNISIHPLYGILPYKEQYVALVPNKFGKRKVVLATSIAETSLTIEGVRVVIDTGFTRRSRFDIASGLSKLETVRISKDAADQRAGRAGRLAPGVCYRMWSLATHERLAEQRIPEIMDADLCSLILELSKWGAHDVNSFCWLSPPPKSAVQQAYETLHQISALENFKLTEHGKQIHQLACHPRIAHMLLMADTTLLKQLACDIAGILEERDFLSKDAGADLNLRIETLRRARVQNTFNNKLKRVDKNADSFRKLLNIPEDNAVVDAYDTGLLLAYAFPERIASAKPGNNAQFQLSNGKIAAIGHQDSLAHESWLAVANMSLRDGIGKIFLAAPLNPKDLIHLVKETETIYWDTHKGGLICANELKIGNIVLQSKPLQNPDKSKIVDVIIKAIQTEADTLLHFNEAFYQLQNRINSLKIWNKDDTFPNVELDALIKNAYEWLAPFLNDIKYSEDLKKIDLSACLLHVLSWEQQQQLEQLVPEKIEVPSGSKIRITYFFNGESPVIAVRLQEVFGWLHTPLLNNGKIKTLLHLLSPGYKPVQVTNDLDSFWNHTYFEVRKELQRRYPKHAWPENPLQAKPVAKGRKFNS